MRVLIAAPLSTDLIIRASGAIRRPGGPPVYAGGAAALQGHEVYSFGGWGYENMCALRVERLLGVERLGQAWSGPGAVFALRYHGSKRRVEMLSPPPKICSELLWAHRLTRPDIVIVSPIYGDICPQILPLLRRGSLVALDVQGYHRAGMSASIPPGAADLIHASGEEARDIPRGAAPLIVETNGYGPVRLRTRDGRLILVAEKPPGPVLEDPTGAGDVFTLLLSLELARGHTPLDAARRASAMVHRLLVEVQERVAREGCP